MKRKFKSERAIPILLQTENKVIYCRFLCRLKVVITLWFTVFKSTCCSKFHIDPSVVSDVFSHNINRCFLFPHCTTLNSHIQHLSDLSDKLSHITNICMKMRKFMHLGNSKEGHQKIFSYLHQKTFIQNIRSMRIIIGRIINTFRAAVAWWSLL